jgi:hypothetical protein
MNSYIEHELKKGTATWTTLQQNFIVIFSFEHENPNIYETLKKIRVIFIEGPGVKHITEE